MAGMFYSLEETAKKLGKTEEQIKELVKQGKLREFRDGSNLLFKFDEIEALASGTGAPAKTEGLEQPEQPLEIEEPAAQEQPAEPPQPPDMEETHHEEISLAPETGIPAAESGLTDADTALTGEGVRVLGETDKDYQLTEDSMAETMGETGAPGKTSLPESPMEKIEEDVNLDSFGSGSGLLDLSLQADDTSLGGILDEIYTTEGGEGQEPAAEPGSAVEMVDEAEQILPEEEAPIPEPSPETTAIVHSYAEAPSDAQNYSFVILLSLSIVMLLYTAVVVISGQRAVVPSILSAIQGAIWYIVIGAIVVAGVLAGVAFGLGGGLGKLPKKPPKPKKEKKAKKAPPPALEDTSL